MFIKNASPCINGRFVPKTGVKLSPVICPRSEKVLSEVGIATAAHVDEAVRSARSAHNLLRKIPGSRLRDSLLEISDLLKEHRSDFAYLESLSGKLRSESEADVDSSIEVLRYFAGYADNLTSEYFNNDPYFQRYTIREALGVCGLITSFNYPLC